MNRILVIILCFFLCNCSAQKRNAAQKEDQYLRAMYVKNTGRWYKTMTFVQTTEFYRNDSMIRKATWYESLKLPYDLRIDMEDPAKGNFVLYKKDSVYRFQNNKLRNVSGDTNPFIFFIGGMYYQPYDSALSYLSSKGYDVKKGYETNWKGSPAWVVGRSNEADSSNAIWIDKKNLWIVRLVEKANGRTIDAHMREQKKLAKGTTETLVDIYVNGKLVQVEKYDQINIDVPLDDNLHDPLNATSAKHWFHKD